MVPIEKAIRIITRETCKLTSERVPLESSVGRILAENIAADTDLPPFDRSQMDGYAVIAADTVGAPVTLKIVGESAAGKGWRRRLKRGETVQIMTGAPVPAGADAVQRIELTTDDGFAADLGSVTILQPVKKGTAIVRKGTEVKKGKIIIKAGEVVTSNNISTIAAFGYPKVRISKRPRVGILATGSEIVPVSKTPRRDQIRNSNSVMLRALAESAGAECEIFAPSGDDLSNLTFQISNSAKRRDILIITGGVSVGKYDLTKAALVELGAKIFIEKLDLKPGKPMVFARLGKTLVFGLPGNPVSAAVTFYVFVRMALMRLQGAAQTRLRKGRARLASASKAAKDRDTYLPAALSISEDGVLTAASLRSQGSSDLVGFSRADSLIFLRKGESGRIGDTVDILFL
jgi:molybdopterin molybdotransferase